MKHDALHGLDPITLEIWWSRLIAIADEAAKTLLRTAFSTIVQESNDFATVLMNAKGQSIAECSGGIPAFAGLIPRTAKALIEQFGIDEFKDGDVLITNDPWLTTGHLPDITIITPIFYGEELVGFAGSAAHSPDVGGSHSMTNREIFEEGLCIPPMFLYRNGRRNEGMLELLLNNVRLPDQVIGDIEAQVTANEVCRKRAIEFLESCGMPNFALISVAVHARSEYSMRRAIAEIPDGTYTSIIEADGIPNAPTRISCCITVTGDSMTVDYSGSSTQVPVGINCTMNYTQAYSIYPLKCLLDPNTRRNEGSYIPIQVRAPEGSILNAKRPAPVAARHLTGHLLSCAIYQALADVLSNKVLADSGGAPAMRVYFGGLRANGSRFGQILFASGGMGASANNDGLSTTAFPTNSGAGSIEALEAAAPLMVLKKEFRIDSGGAGRMRGGLGQTCEILNISDRPVQVGVLADRKNHPALGFAGGNPGAPAAVVQQDGGEVPLKSVATLLPGSYMSFQFAGGGGYGPSKARCHHAIRNDIEMGYVSPRSAAHEYGFKEAM